MANNKHIPNYTFDGDFFAPNSEVSHREQANIIHTLNNLPTQTRMMIYKVIKDQRIIFSRPQQS